MELGLRGRVALVSGGSGAIGAACAESLAAEGAAVAVGYTTRREAAVEVVKRIRASGGAASAVRIDHADTSSLAAAVDTVTADLGAPGVLVGCGVSWPIPTQSHDNLMTGLAANLAGPLELVEQVLPAMRRRSWGRIVLISTDIVDQPVPGGTGYPAAKAGLEAAARVLAVREAPYGVLTTVVRPGFTLTEKALSAPGFGQEVVDAEAARTPTGRICTPDDVARLVAFLASDANGHVNGEVVSVAGGRQLVR